MTFPRSGNAARHGRAADEMPGPSPLGTRIADDGAWPWLDALIQELACMTCGSIRWHRGDASVIAEPRQSRARLGMFRAMDASDSVPSAWICVCGAPSTPAQTQALDAM